MKETNHPRWAFIVDPIVGNGHALKTEKEIKKQVKLRNLTAEFVRSEKKGHASVLAEEMAKKGNPKRNSPSSTPLALAEGMPVATI